MRVVTEREIAPRFAEVDGVRIAYCEAGAGGEPLILVHGLCSMSYTWQGVFAAFAARGRTIALDLKGFGASDKPAGDYRLDAQAEIVAGLMARLGVRQAVVVGSSMGGAVALRLAARWGERVTRLVLVDPAVYQAHLRSQLARWVLAPSGAVGGLLAFRAFNLFARSPLIIEHRMRFVYGRREAITPERVAAYHAAVNDAGCQRAIIATLQAWDLGAVERDLRQVRQPALIVWGARDRFIRPHFGRRLARDLPQAELRLLPCGHVPQEEMPAEFAGLVLDFLARRAS